MTKRMCGTIALGVALALGGVETARADVYAEVMPELRTVTRGTGTAEASLLAKDRLKAVTRGTVEGAPADVADQAYRIEIAADGVRVTAGGEAGARYAQLTLDQLRRLSDDGKVPCATVVDWPQFKWRGVMNDCGRNFLDLEGVRAIIDIAARYKMNLFHWHLTEYHGWRLESKRYPALTDPKNFTRQIGRFYTQEEFRDTVAYAKARGVVVMPELDVPGHTYALRRGLGVEKMSDPKVAKAVDEIIEELCALVPAEDMPFVHLGTDEARIDAEYVSKTQCSAWAQTVARHGHKAVRWAPGEPMEVKDGEVIDMVWHDAHVTNSTYRAFDAARMYFASTDPFELVHQTLFTEPCRWAVDPRRKLGAVACAWHDDAVGDETMKLFRDVVFFPATVGFADNYWHGNPDAPRYCNRGGRLPVPGTDEFARWKAYESRMRAQRDRVLADFGLPFQFLSQTDLRWRITDVTANSVVARDVVGGTVRPAAYGLDKKHVGVVETWVHAPKARTVGAWIALLPFGTAYVRSGYAPSPDRGTWNRFGGTVELNGRTIDPPEWRNPGLKHDKVRDADEKKSYRGAVYSNNVCETPLTDEEVTLRDPIALELKAGWNHVAIRLPAAGGDSRIFTLAFLDGPTVRPREPQGLTYASEGPNGAN